MSEKPPPILDYEPPPLRRRRLRIAWMAAIALLAPMVFRLGTGYFDFGYSANATVNHTAHSRMPLIPVLMVMLWYSSPYLLFAIFALPALRKPAPGINPRSRQVAAIALVINLIMAVHMAYSIWRLYDGYL